MGSSKLTGQRGPTRILIVDDHPLVRLSLREFIRREKDLEVCGEAEDKEQALAAAAATKPHLAIIDLTLKSSNGMELIKDLRERHPEVQILVLSMHDETIHAERAIRAGARGYITKQEATTKVMVAIRQILSGEIYWSERAAARIASKIAGPAGGVAESPVDCLTDRELQVFEMIGSGRSTRQIAAALHIDVSTVETYRARIKDKLNLKDSLALLQYAIRWQIGNAQA
ncbi:MAG TPA: response regulator transcription factor [Verrucomicrobiae bacterium]|nr:response regulator transcription factor [Verrucomicrobiae bacterium]